MKKWEVKKVNELYEQLDQVKQQNNRLNEHNTRLEEQNVSLLKQNKQLQVYVNNATSGDGLDVHDDIRSDLAEIKRLLTPVKTKRVTRKTGKK